MLATGFFQRKAEGGNITITNEDDRNYTTFVQFVQSDPLELDNALSQKRIYTGLRTGRGSNPMGLARSVGDIKKCHLRLSFARFGEMRPVVLPPANWSPASWPVSWECNPSLGTSTDSSGNANQLRLAPWCGGGLSLPHTATAIIAGHGLEYIFGQGVQPMELCQWEQKTVKACRNEHDAARLFLTRPPV